MRPFHPDVGQRCGDCGGHGGRSICARSAGFKLGLIAGLLLGPSARADAPDRQLSWTAIPGPIPSSGLVAFGEMGYPNVPRLGVLFPIAESLALGGAIAFDVGGTRPAAGFRPIVYLSAPVRFTAPLDLGVALAVAGEVGIGIGGDARPVAVSFGGSADLVSRPWPQIALGGGVAIPAEWSSAGGGHLGVPILLGGTGEWHPTPNLGVFGEARAGPHLDTALGVAFGLKLGVGIAIRL